MEIVAILGHTKEGSGKEVASKIRRQGLVPCVMYKSGGGEATSFTANPSEFRSLVYTSKFKIAEITFNGKMHRCILKAIQFHPVTDAVLHLDFLELVPEVKFKANIPILFEGISPGVKSGGKFLAKMRTVSVLATPETAVDQVIADISAMDLGSTIRVRDIKLVSGIEILNTGAIPIASIEIPRALRGGPAAK